ncbi:MAG: hypothetical protein QM723_15180 [Myxococcaceae bacterium]
MSRTGLAVAVLMVMGCTTVTQESSVLSIAPFKHRCEDHEVSAHLTRIGDDELELSATASGVCRDGEVRTVKVEQYSESWIPAGLVGTLVGSVIEVPILIGLFWFSQKASAGGANLSNLGDAAWVVILPGLLVGTAVGAGIGSTHFRLPDAPPHKVEEITATENRDGPAQGSVAAEDDLKLRFAFVDGKARIPISAVWKHDLGRLLVNGVLVELDEPSRAIATELSSCRRAVHRWKLGEEGSCEDEAARLTWAKTCHLAGYSYADQVLGRLQSMGCQ